MSIDTGSPLMFFERQPNERVQMTLRDFFLLDGQLDTATVVRGEFHGIEVLPVPLDQTAPTGISAVMGGSLLKNFSVQFDFGKPTMTFWPRQGASDGFLSSAGFAVLQFGLLGGAELTATSRPDFLGLTGPVEEPPTRVVLRACGAPRAFDPVNETQDMNRCCKRGDEALPAQATGTNLALVLATGVGPLVLSQSAWNRLALTAVQAGTPLPPLGAGPSLPIPSLPAALSAAEVQWSTLPRLALVDQESDDATNPGPCVELGRARRLEWVESHQVPLDGHAPECPQVCDTDPRNAGRAQNSAAYIEIGDDIPVAVVPDGTPFLQGLRAEIRPEGPEVDGLVGAGVLGHTVLELDYRSTPNRALFTCADGAGHSTLCWTRPRCPRLLNRGDTRSCFGLPAQSLPVTCEPSGCG